jgi:hypothetical protein
MEELVYEGWLVQMEPLEILEQLVAVEKLARLE